ncbi:hypothetical protein CWO84_16935 [Methylomonas sp. Kb3]|nr:hypothetical protein CWO84_16935 [Methylomonas sp. Kb3]
MHLDRAGFLNALAMAALLKLIGGCEKFKNLLSAGHKGESWDEGVKIIIYPLTLALSHRERDLLWFNLS